MFPAKTDSTSWKMHRTPMMYPIQQRHLIKVIRSSKMTWLRIMTNTGEALVMDWTTAMEIICHAWKRQLRRAPAKTVKDKPLFSKTFRHFKPKTSEGLQGKAINLSTFAFRVLAGFASYKVMRCQMWAYITDIRIAKTKVQRDKFRQLMQQLKNKEWRKNLLLCAR